MSVVGPQHADRGVRPREDQAWEAKLASDRARAALHQSRKEQSVTEELLRRAQAEGAQGFALTGSVARGKQTVISDLDYHVIGSRPRYADLPADIDIRADTVERFWVKLRSGDDFAQWTLRYGCILFDTGVFRAGLKAIGDEALWPDAQANLARLPKHVELASRLIEVGDPDASQAEVRAALTTAARGVLLEAGEFPLARSELPDQLRSVGYERLARALSATIHSERSLAELERDLASLEPLIHADAGVAHPSSRVKRMSNALRRTG